MSEPMSEPVSEPMSEPVSEPPLNEARVDHDRTERIDMPEAVYCAAKTVDQCVSIVSEMLDRGADAVVATRTTDEQRRALSQLTPSPSAVEGTTMTWNHRPPTAKNVVVVTGGTSDLPVANECHLTLSALGHQSRLVIDVGVAGLHRLLGVLDELRQAQVLVAIAGMEGALPTVLAGLVAQPIIAVPTSVGYGTANGGQTALNSMLTSCAPGIAVVGIDNGYGAACATHRILGSQP